MLDEMSVDDLAAEAVRLGYTPAQIVAAVEARIVRDQAYLRRRRRRGTATPTDEAMLRDLPILAVLARSFIPGAALPTASGSLPPTAIMQIPPTTAPISITLGEHERHNDTEDREPGT